MSSKRKQTNKIRERKKQPNKSNQKADLKRIQKNAEILRDLAANDEAKE